MSISEYMDAEQMAAYAGSLDNGAIDAEYTPRPYIVAPPLGDVVAEQGKQIATLQAEVAHLSRLLHKALNAKCIDDYGDEVSA